MVNSFSNPKDMTRPNCRWRFVVVGATFVTATTIGELSSWAQPGGGYGGGYGGPITGYYSPGMGGGFGMENPNDPPVKAKIEASQGLHHASSEFRRAQGDAAKATAQKKLQEALAKYFDADMKVREANLQKVEAQVKTLRAQFDKRASKKQEILDLQLKLLENEADGLGFFGIPTAAPPPEAALMSSPGWAEKWRLEPGAPQPPNGARVEPAVPVPTNSGGVISPSPSPRPREESGDEKSLPGGGATNRPFNETRPNE